MNDINGRPIFITDEVAGYGLSHPGFGYPVWGREELQPGNSAGTAVTMVEGLNDVYNPVWWVVVRMRLAHTIAGTSSVSMFLEIKDGSTIIATSSTQVEAVTGVVFSTRNFMRMCAIPATSIAHGLLATVRVHTPVPADFGVTAYPLQSKGTSRAFYDLNPAFT